MVQAIQWSLVAQIQSGPRVSTSQTIEIEAYDVIKLGIESGAVDAEVELQPGGAGQVKALIVTSNNYGNGLVYKVNNIANPEIMIDQPQVFMGEGAVGLLDSAAPGSLFFSNTLAEAAEIEILIGRDATPPTP